MRAESLSRLSGFHFTKFDTYYLHYKSFHQELMNAIKGYANGKVLDIGCGNKPYEKMFEGKITDYTGCDIVQSNEMKVDVICEATDIPLKDQSFDTIFSTQTIEHVSDHQKLLNEAWRLLKPGGYIIVSGPLYWPLHEEPYDFFRFTKHGFNYILEKAGFEVIAVNPNGGAWASLGLSLMHAMSNKHPQRPFLLRAMRTIFFKLRLHWVVNAVCGKLDKIDFHPGNTINYVAIGRRQE
jgi:SAM-dependent methyltransferase